MPEKKVYGFYMNTDIREMLEHMSTENLRTLSAELELAIRERYERQQQPHNFQHCPDCGEVLTAAYPTPASPAYCIRCAKVVEQPRQLVDESVPYHTHAEPVYGPASGYTPWAKDETEKVTP